LLLFPVLYSVGVANIAAFNGDALGELAVQFLALAEKEGATVPLMIGHRLMGISLSYTGDIAEGRTHFDRAIALYDPAEHRLMAARFGQDAGVSSLSLRSQALGLLGYPEAALADAGHRPSCHADVALFFTTLPASFAETTRQQAPRAMNSSLWRKKRSFVLEGSRYVGAWRSFCLDRQSLGQHDHIRLMTQSAHASCGTHTIKLLPPLTISDEDCGWIERSFEAVIAGAHRTTGAVWKLGKTLVSNAVRARAAAQLRGRGGLGLADGVIE
jgi:hypothetical protein